MRLIGYMDKLAWSQTELARRADISPQSIGRALDGQRVSRRVASAILAALSDGYGRKLTMSDVEGLNIVQTRRRKKPVAPEEKQEEKQEQAPKVTRVRPEPKEAKQG